MPKIEVPEHLKEYLFCNSTKPANSLIQGEINRFIKNNNICTCEEFFAAVKSGCIEKLTTLNYIESYLFFEHKKGQTALHIACENGHAGKVAFLLAEGANVDANNAKRGVFQGANNCTPLHLACYEGHVAIVKLLLQAGANIEAINSYNQTPLYTAVSESRQQVIEALLEANADPEGPSFNYYNPLSYARGTANKKLIQLLTAAKEKRSQPQHDNQNDSMFSKGWQNLLNLFSSSPSQQTEGLASIHSRKRDAASSNTNFLQTSADDQDINNAKRPKRNPS